MMHERLAYWQRQLRLQDWNITVEYSGAHDLRGSCANTRIIASSKEARILLLAEDEWPPVSQRVGIYDDELFLIHELLHLHLDMWKGEAVEKQDSPEWNAKESAIDLIATALLRLRRG